jgi:hypothetical protein
MELKMTEYDISLHKRIYEIRVDDYQIVQLIELQNGNFEGSLTNSTLAINSENNEKKRINQKIKIPKSIVSFLMEELKQNGVENISDSNNKWPTGNTTFFTVKTDKVDRTYSHWELESDYYYTEPDIPDEVRKSRKIMDLINENFDLKQQYKNFICRFSFSNDSYKCILMGAKTEKGTKAYRLPADIVKKRTKRVIKQLEKNGFLGIQILSIEEVDHILTMAEKNDDSHKVVSNAFRRVISENDFRNLKITETIYLQVKFLEKANPGKLRIVKLNSSFKFEEIIQ